MIIQILLLTSAFFVYLLARKYVRKYDTLRKYRNVTLYLIPFAYFGIVYLINAITKNDIFENKNIATLIMVPFVIIFSIVMAEVNYRITHGNSKHFIEVGNKKEKLKKDLEDIERFKAILDAKNIDYSKYDDAKIIEVAKESQYKELFKKNKTFKKSK